MPKGAQLPSFPCLLPADPSTDVSRTVLTYSLQKAMRSGCSSRGKSGWEGCVAAQGLTFKGLLTAPAWAVRCRPEEWKVQDKAVEAKRTRAMLKQLPPVPSLLHPHWLPISSSPVAGGRLPPTPGLRHGVPTVGTFLQLPRHQTPPTCIPLISANTALCQWSLFKRYASHPRVSETHLTIPL